MKWLVVVALALLAGCGTTPEAGETCSTENEAACDGAQAAFFCNSGTWRAVSCRGPGGCNEGTSQVVCDLSRAQPGDGCPKSAEGQAQCNAANVDSGLKCTMGVWQAQTCKACAVQAGQVVCQQ